MDALFEGLLDLLLGREEDKSEDDSVVSRNSAEVVPDLENGKSENIRNSTKVAPDPENQTSVASEDIDIL
jgi:hypothetical protein